MEQAELSKLLDHVQAYYSSLDPKSYSKLIDQSSYRPSLAQQTSPSMKSSMHRLNSYGPHPSFIVNEGSSDEGSDEDKCFPSILQVTEQILDSKYTVITV